MDHSSSQDDPHHLEVSQVSAFPWRSHHLTRMLQERSRTSFQAPSVSVSDVCERRGRAVVKRRRKIGGEGGQEEEEQEEEEEEEWSFPSENYLKNLKEPTNLDMLDDPPAQTPLPSASVITNSNNCPVKLIIN
ncbi:hypothetical protein KOW79_019082 [Hemibagrus wyckioides]|uniref:Uncharacterized protein n=1 Tax=Hemibagrus wyckioides TaxID=337641 RepID=A0A9D3NBT8_9TELE|nr:hypothetical protein KOW79_019082 [Hemibagrus wyckioides]